MIVYLILAKWWSHIHEFLMHVAWLWIVSYVAYVLAIILWRNNLNAKNLTSIHNSIIVCLTLGWWWAIINDILLNLAWIWMITYVTYVVTILVYKNEYNSATFAAFEVKVRRLCEELCANPLPMTLTAAATDYDDGFTVIHENIAMIQ